MASKGVNKVIIVGNLGADPEVRHTQTGTAICNLSIATSEHWKDKQTGEPRELTEWHRCTAYRRLAEICGEYLKKGSKVYVEGRLQTRKWQDQQGVDRYTTEIVIAEMQMLDSRGSNSGQNAPANNQQQNNYQANNSQNQQQGGYQQQNQPPRQPQSQPGPMGNQPPDFDDDIPF